MKKYSHVYLAIFLSVFLMVKVIPIANAGLDDFLKDATKIFDTEKGLSDSDIINGLKEALQVGTGNAVSIKHFRPDDSNSVVSDAVDCYD